MERRAREGRRLAGHFQAAWLGSKGNRLNRLSRESRPRSPLREVLLVCISGSGRRMSPHMQRRGKHISGVGMTFTPLQPGEQARGKRSSGGLRGGGVRAPFWLLVVVSASRVGRAGMRKDAGRGTLSCCPCRTGRSALVMGIPMSKLPQPQPCSSPLKA